MRPGAGSSRRWPRSGRSCSCSRTCTGPTTRCSTSSTSWSSARRACRCSCSAPRGRSCSSGGPGWGGGKPNALTISLSPLSDDETGAPRPVAARAAAARRADAGGAARARGRQPALRRAVRARSCSSAGDLDELPETVQGIIAARLDALSERGEAAAPGRGRRRQGLLARARVEAVGGVDALQSRGAALRARAQGVRPALPRAPRSPARASTRSATC